MTSTATISASPAGVIDLADFRVDLARLPYQAWLQLGEAASKSRHIGRAPLSPDKWTELHVVYLVKGVHSTTAIEGNTLSEDEVLAIFRRESTLPPSRQYLQQEVRNILDAMNKGYRLSERGKLTAEELDDLNAITLQGIQTPDHVTPGKLRTTSVGVGRYICPRPQDVPRFLQSFVDWYNDFPETLDGIGAEATAIVKAIATHLYFVLIHPYGDGNGRTARLLEWRTLDAAGIATPVVHLLSNHYNLTRTRYYDMLDRASLRGDVTSFFAYAVEGFVDGLTAQLEHFYRAYAELVFANLVRQKSVGKAWPIVQRRQRLAIAIAKSSEPVSRAAVRSLSPKLQAAYATATDKTISRDLHTLMDSGLISHKGTGWVAVTDPMYWRHVRKPT